MINFLITMVIAAGIVILLAPVMIPLLHKLKFGQSIREEGPASHQKKSGTPIRVNENTPLQNSQL